MLNQVKANEYNIKEMSASVLSLLKYVKTVSHDGHPGIEGDSPREEEEEQSPENPTEHFDNAVPENDPIAPSWTLWRNELHVLSSSNVVCDFETGSFLQASESASPLFSSIVTCMHCGKKNFH